MRKTVFCILIPGFFIALVGCSKKEVTQSVVKPSVTLDSPRVSAAATVYPRTDTFAGKLQVVFMYINGYSKIYNNYSFYVTYISEDKLVFSSAAGIELQGGSVVNINDTTTRIADSIGRGTMVIHDDEHGYNIGYANSIVYTMVQDTLKVSWDIINMPVSASCDVGESTGQFTGLLKK